MTLDDLLIDCCTRLNYPPDLTIVEPKVLARLTAFLNQTQQEILGQPSFKRLLRMGHTLHTEAGQHAYGLPQQIERIVSIVDRRNQRRLRVMSSDAYRRYLPNPAVQQGTPEAYAFDGWGSLQYQPTAAETVYAYSSVQDDGTIISCRAVIPNLTPAADNWIRHSVVLNAAAGGVLFVAPGGTAPAFISDVTTSEPVKAGSVDVMVGQPPVRFLARISQGQNRGRFAQIYLIPTPSGALELDIIGVRPVTPLSTPGEESSTIPPTFHYLLAAGARMKEYELRGDTSRYAIAKREYDTGLAFLNSWVSDQPDAGDQMHPDDGRQIGSSVLGPWFPISGYR